MTNIQTEVLDGTTYFSAESARGNVTTVWDLFGTVFVQTNRSAPKAMADIAKPSKDVKAIVAYMASA